MDKGVDGIIFLAQNPGMVRISRQSFDTIDKQFSEG